MDGVCFLKRGKVQFPRGKKVIKAEEYAVYAEAEDILEKARQDAEQIIAEAGQVYEEEKERGYQDGMMEGKLAHSEQMMDTVTKTVAYLGSMEEKVIDIVMQAVRKILGEMDDRELIVKVVRQALSVVRNQKQVALRVSPGQVETVKEKLNEIAGDYPVISFIDVLPDGRLQNGGCILESEVGVVDASVDVQVKAIQRAVMKSFKKSGE